MKEKLMNEYEQFKKIYNNIYNNLAISMLTDIVGYMAEIKDNTELDFTKFDESVENIKELLKSAPIDSIKSIKNNEIFKGTLNDDLVHVDKMKDECTYSMRTLDWILNGVLKEEEDENNA